MGAAEGRVGGEVLRMRGRRLHESGYKTSVNAVQRR